MQIVPQSAAVSYSHFPSGSSPHLALPPPPDRPRLPAPPSLLLLPAPQMALSQPRCSQPISQIDALRLALGPVRTKEMMDAELAALAFDALRDLQAMRRQVTDRLARKGMRP